MPSSKKIPDFALATDRSLLSNARFQMAGSFGKKLINLKFLIMHYTAGRSLASTVEHFQNPASKASAHLVVGRNGEVVQMVTFDRPAWHAGADSSWTYVDAARQSVRLDHMNFYSLGIEFDNYGPLKRVGHLLSAGSARVKFVTWFGHTVPSDEVCEVDPKAKGSFGVQYWHTYSNAQIEVAEKLAKLLVREFGLVDILGHSDVAPRRKTDPGPLFPMKNIRSLVFGRADEEDVCSCERPDVKAGVCTVCSKPGRVPA